MEKDRTKLLEAKDKLSLAQKQSSQTDRQLDTAEKQYHKELLRLLGAENESYFSACAKKILEYADKNQLDPEWVYRVLRTAELDVCSYNDPERYTSHQRLYYQATDMIHQNGGGEPSPRAHIAADYLKKAIELAKAEENGAMPETEKPSRAYQVALDWVYSLAFAQEADFWAHY